VGTDDDQFNVTADVGGASAMDLYRCEMGADDGMLPLTIFIFFSFFSSLIKSNNHL
jgi:hypothetical protein